MFSKGIKIQKFRPARGEEEDPPPCMHWHAMGTQPAASYVMPIPLSVVFQSIYNGTSTIHLDRKQYTHYLQKKNAIPKFFISLELFFEFHKNDPLHRTFT